MDFMGPGQVPIGIPTKAPLDFWYREKLEDLRPSTGLDIELAVMKI